MQDLLKQQENATGICFPEEPLNKAESRRSNTLSTETIGGHITFTPEFHHKSLKERAEAYGGKLNLSNEMAQEKPVGCEVW